jgi:hypothetical protein
LMKRAMLPVLAPLSGMSSARRATHRSNEHIG